MTRFVAGAVLALAAGLVAPAPAQAAACSPGAGVTVVVDRGDLGGGTSTVCQNDGGGEVASTVITDAGFTLTYVQRTPGFVCRVDGQPTAEQDPCVNTPPTDAYWGVFWSNGTSGDWTYSNAGVGSLEVPEGGSVALVWQSSDQRRQPTVPPPAQATSSPSSSPSSSPTKNPSSSPTSQAPSATSSPSQQLTSSSPTTSPSGSVTSTPTTERSRTESPSPSDGPSGTPTETPTEDDPDDPVTSAASPVAADPRLPNEGGGLPTWVVLVVLGGLGVGVVAMTLSRKIS